MLSLKSEAGAQCTAYKISIQTGHIVSTSMVPAITAMKFPTVAKETQSIFVDRDGLYTRVTNY